MINSCHTLCDTTYQSCFDACNGDPTCEAGCLATKNTCDSNCAATDYAGNIHNFLWGGSLYEPETNLYWMRNRYYHKDMHRFINQDPIGIWGDANNLGNGFAYVAGMVIEASDPTGLEYQSNSELGNTILSNGNATSSTFQSLNNNGNGNVVIVEDGKLPEIRDDKGNKIQASGACFKDNNIYVEQSVAENGKQVDRPGMVGIMIDSYTVSPEAVVAHEMAEKAELERRQEERNKEKAEGRGNGELTQADRDAAHQAGVLAEKLVMQQQKEEEERRKKEEEKKKKEEEEAKAKAKDKKYPGDPDDSNDSFQQRLMENMLAKRLKTEVSSIHDQGPVIRIQVDGPSGKPRWVFVFNPFYKGPDPMKQIMWEIENADGTRGYVRNPFALGADTKKQQELRKLIESDGVIGPSVFWNN